MSTISGMYMGGGFSVIVVFDDKRNRVHFDIHTNEKEEKYIFLLKTLCTLNYLASEYIQKKKKKLLLL